VFSLRRNLGSARHWNRSFLSQLQSDLIAAGFDDLEVKLPVNLGAIVNEAIPVQQRIEAELLNREVTFQEFLDAERNYPAIILVAENAKREETIKVLFVNTSRKTAFMDDTFPSGHSVPSQIYVQSPDPARAYSLLQFFYEFLRREGASTALLSSLGVLALFLTGAEIVAFISSKQGIIATVWGFNTLVDVAAIVALILIQYASFKAPTGISVNERETITAQSLFIRAIRGEFRDNPLVNIAVGVAASLISAIILRVIGWP
jgi:hypothetical protein